MTGERAIGHEAIRAYWTNQWMEINTEVIPISYRFVDNQVIVEVHQLIKSMDGATLSDSVVYHSYSFIGHHEIMLPLLAAALKQSDQDREKA